MTRNPQLVRGGGQGESGEFVLADFNDSASLEAALAGVDAAFLLMANTPDQYDCERRFVDAALTSGVQHLVKMSALGADENSPIELKRCHGQAESYIESSGIPYTHIRPNFFMQNLLHLSDPIKSDGVIPLPMKFGSVGAIDTRDVAEVVLKVLGDADYFGQCLEISGSESLSFDNLASIISERLRKPVEYVDIDTAVFRQQMSSLGQSDWYIDAQSALFASIAENASAGITPTVEQVMGKKPRLFSQFVADHAKEFTG